MSQTVRSASQPKPVRPFRRFMEQKKCNTGIDPVKNFEHFIGRDVSYSMHRTRRTITLNEDYASVPKGKVPFGTTKHTYKLGLTNEGRLDRNSMGYATQNFPRSPTDHISSEPPATERPFQNLFDRMMGSAKYEKNTKSSNPWSPRAPAIATINNRNSVRHNIISHEPNAHTPAVGYTERLSKSFNRTKGIAQIDDLKRSTAINRNIDHTAAITSAQNVFSRKDGIFTHLYNSAARFGENKPFKA